MNAGSKRMLIALLLTVAAVAAPCTLWYIAGSREIDRQTSEMLEQPRREAMQAATQLAQQLTDRLQMLRENESDRPFFHYQNLYHDTRGAYGGRSVVPSPLADGPTDSLVVAHFQIDPQGKVTLPTLNDDIPERNTTNDQSQQRAFLAKIKPASMQLAAALVDDGMQLALGPVQQGGQQMLQQRGSPLQQVENDTNAQNAPNASNVEGQPNQTELSPGQTNNQTDRIDSQTQSAANASRTQQKKQQQQAQRQSGSPTRQQRSVDYRSYSEVQSRLQEQRPAGPEQVQRIAPDVWSQNALANAVYQDIKSPGRKGSKAPVKGGTNKISKDKDSSQPVGQPAMKGEVVIRIGAVQWRTVELDDKPALAGLRQVSAPSGVWTQGFTVSAEQVHRWLNNRKGALYPAKLVDGPKSSDIAVPLEIAGADWHIAVDADEATGDAAREAAVLKSGFHLRFSVIASVAALAGLCLVGLVCQSDRLARKRAQFAASAAHELRTPLAGLRMYGEMLADGLGDPGKSTVYARRVADEAERLGRVVTNVLSFTKLERGTLSVKPLPGDLGAVVEECVQKQQPRMEATDATLTLEIAEQLPPVRFDRDAVFQIVHNLIDNAEKYSRGSDDRNIHVTVNTARIAGRSMVSIAVSDHGPGVAAAATRRIFQPFTRGSDPDAPAGLGLGLALTRALTSAQRAHIAYSDTPTGGATFSVSFPAG